MARSSNAAPGPSKPTAAGRRKQSPSPLNASGDEENPVVIEGEEDELSGTTGRRTTKSTKGGKASAVNGKGKAKAGAKTTRVAKKTSGAHVEIDSDEDGPSSRPQSRSEIKRLQQDLEDVCSSVHRMAEACSRIVDQAQMRSEQLSRQVEELIRARETEPEELLRQYQEAADKTIEGIHPYLGALPLLTQDFRPE